MLILFLNNRLLHLVATESIHGLPVALGDYGATHKSQRMRTVFIIGLLDLPMIPSWDFYCVLFNFMLLRVPLYAKSTRFLCFIMQFVFNFVLISKYVRS